jgi:iron complex outermembrane receptor protein
MTRSALPLALAVLGGLAPAVRAQAPQPSPSPSPAPTHGEYVEVTATRFPEFPGEVPAPIEVITGQELQDRGAKDLTSALNLAAGVVIAPGGDNGPASSVPEFWGLKEFDAFLLVVDGVPWGGAFNPALTTLNLTDLDRIEVLRGAAPVMFGATSFVGVIHVVHRDPANTQNLIETHGGSFTSGGGALTAKLPDWGGFASSLNLDGDRVGFKDDRTTFSRGHLLWRNSRPAGAGRFHFDVDGTLVDQDPASPHPRDGRVLTDLVPLDANNNPGGSYLNDRRLAVSVGLDRPLRSADWSTIVSFSRAKNDALHGFLVDLAPVDPNAHGFRNTIKTTDIYFDTHVTWSGSSRYRVVAGLDHLHGKGSAHGGDFDYFVNLDGSNPPDGAQLPSAADIHINDRRDFSGLYGFLEWTPGPAWRLEVGGRVNRTDESRDTSLLDIESQDFEQGSGKLSKVRASGTAALMWTPWRQGLDSLGFFGGYRNSYKPAAIDFGLDSAPDVLNPETAESYELGSKIRTLDGRLSIEVSAFLMDFDNLVTATIIDGLPGLINTGKQRFKGVEAAVAWRLANHLSGRATYSLHDAKFTDFVQEFDGVPTQLAGKRLEMSARHLASAGLVYAPPQGLTGVVELNYVGSRFLNKRNTAPVEGYATLSMGAGYRTGRWEFRVDGRNLTDRRDAVSESELGDAQYYRMTARRVDAAVAVKF